MKVIRCLIGTIAILLLTYGCVWASDGLQVDTDFIRREIKIYGTLDYKAMGIATDQVIGVSPWSPMEVTVVVYKPIAGESSPTVENLVFYDQKVADASGNYSFDFKMRSNTGDYYVVVNTSYGFEYRTVFHYEDQTLGFFNQKLIDGILSEVYSSVEQEATFLGLNLNFYNKFDTLIKEDVCKALILHGSFQTKEKLISFFNQSVLVEAIKNNWGNIEILSVYDQCIASSDDVNLHNIVNFISERNIFNDIIESLKKTVNLSSSNFSLSLRENTLFTFCSSIEYYMDLDFIFNNGNNIFLIPQDVLNQYNKIKHKNEVLQNLYKVISKITTMDSLVDTFSGLIADQKEIEDSVVVEVPKNKSDGGGRKTTYSAPPPVTIEPAVVEIPKEEQKDIFLDLENTQWVKKAVNELYNKKIISGKGDGIFDPNAYVTREEFVQMIAKAFKFKPIRNVNVFSDVSLNDWYYESIIACYDNNIVTGDGLNFGLGTNILRQDMSVILYRTAKNIKVALKNDAGVPFGDESLADEYAKESIKLMMSSKILNGIGENNFAPKSLVTRAQAAQAIYNLLVTAEEYVMQGGAN